MNNSKTATTRSLHSRRAMGADGDAENLLLGGLETRDGVVTGPAAPMQAHAKAPQRRPPDHAPPHDGRSSHGGSTGSQHVRPRRHGERHEDDPRDRDDAVAVRSRRRGREEQEAIGRQVRRDTSQDIVLRRGEAQVLLDNTRRAIRNVQQSEQICNASAKAFRAEAAALEEGETLLQELLGPDGAGAQTSVALMGSGRR